MFDVGDLVLCVDDAPRPNGELLGIKRGRIYTIREFLNSEHHHGVALEEVGLVCPTCGSPATYRPTRFRPVKVNESSIEIFRELVKTSPREMVDG